ncbi:MAG: NPCBM/NEW2 domain-containing protein [Fimbriimonadales bacterium]
MFQLLSPPQTWIPADDLMPREVRQGWGSLHIGQSVQGRPLQIGDRKFAHGLGTHADSSITFYVAGRVARLQSWIGIDAEMAKYPQASVVFQIFLDGRKAFDSGVMGPSDPAKQVDLDVSKTVELRLVVTDAGDGVNCDHADWADLRLLTSSQTGVSTKVWKGPQTRNRGLSVQMADTEGTMIATLEGRRYRIGMDIEGARPAGEPKAIKGSGGGWTVRQDLVCAGGRRVREIQTLTPDGDSIGWAVKLEGDGTPFSAPIDTFVEPMQPFQVWMAGGRSSQWQDPMDFWRPKREFYAYGNRFDRPLGISLPLASFYESGARHALLLAMSPQDPLLAMDVATRPGGLLFSRTLHRLQMGHPVEFHMNLIPVAPESRAALNWMVNRYPAYFDPPNPNAGRIGGLGAYSGYEGPLEVAKYKAMGFKVNWKASIDFPYMGMFLPPVAPDEQWNRFAGGGAGGYGPGDEGRYGKTSMNQLEAYNRRMRRDGFAVLNYFNVTEFGGNITYPPQPAPGKPRWESPEEFVFGALSKAVLMDPKPLWTWGNAVILDCGEPSYRQFLLDQSQRHLTYLKSNAGICIDRTDWLDRVNPHADDGQAWSHGPVRSLLNSWKSLLSSLGPIMHKSGKVIFINDLIRRLDIMREVDGVYDEFGYDGSNLNTSAFLCLRKPHIAWTADESQLKPDPDAYMQRHLYMGAFPTAPVAANDHTILPSPWADAQYLAYGPLFRALQERKWDLRTGLVRVTGAKANLFQVPGGYVVPLVFAGKSPSVALTLSRELAPKGAAVESICPGETAWRRLTPKSARTYSVPIARGCAMVRIVTKR